MERRSDKGLSERVGSASSWATASLLKTVRLGPKHSQPLSRFVQELPRKLDPLGLDHGSSRIGPFEARKCQDFWQLEVEHGPERKT